MAHVLLLEPNRVLAQTYDRALQSVGHMVSVAFSAEEAIQAADRLQPDVVLLELHLPVHDGIEFLHEFRSYPEWQAIPAIMITNAAPQAVQPYAGVLKQDLGVKKCFYKPRFQLKQLLKVVAEQVAT